MTEVERLRKATAEANQAILDCLPQTCEREFSPRFQEKMCGVFRRANHPILYALPRCVACVVLMMALLGGTWLAVDAEARAAFLGWVREQYETFTEYRFIGEKLPEEEPEEYHLSLVPEGFSEIDRMESEGNTVVVYQNLSGDMIQFFYSQGEDAISLFVDGSCATVEPVWVGNVEAEFYRSDDPEASNALVWRSQDGKTLFCITALLHQDTMIQMAESTQKWNGT